MNNIITDDFRRAAKDYAYLLNQNYPRKTILKLIGDRYLLGKTQRILLNRGIFRKKDVDYRLNKKIYQPSGKSLYVDTYNVLFTISNYLLGRVIFISNDRFLRDAGEVYGKLHQENVFTKSIELLFDYLGSIHEIKLLFLIDQPVSFSGELAVYLKDMLTAWKIPGDARTVLNPDEDLIKLMDGVVVTSDSVIIDESESKIYDIAIDILKRQFQPDFIDLSKLIS